MQENKRKFLVPWFNNQRKDRAVVPENEAPYDIYFVVVDDEKHFRDKTKTELDEFIKRFPNLRVGISYPEDVNQVLKEVMKGNVGNQASVVLVDYVLDNNSYYNWSYSSGALMKWAKKNLGKNFPTTHTNREVPKDIVEHQISWFSKRHGEHLSLVLRMMGYTGSICLLTNMDQYLGVERRVKELRESVPDVEIREPVIDKVLQKEGFTREYYFASSVDRLAIKSPTR